MPSPTSTSDILYDHLPSTECDVQVVHSAAPSPRIPYELIQRVFAYTPRSTLATCLRISTDCFHLAGPLIYRELRLVGKEKRSPFRGMPSGLPKPASLSYTKAKLLAYTRLLEIDTYNDRIHVTQAQGVKPWFPNIETLITTSVKPIYQSMARRFDSPVTNRCIKIKKLVFPPGSDCVIPLFNQCAYNLRKIVMLATPEDVFVNMKYPTNVISHDRLDMIFIVMSDPESRQSATYWTGGRFIEKFRLDLMGEVTSNSNRLPKQYVIVNISAIGHRHDVPVETLLDRKSIQDDMERQFAQVAARAIDYAHYVHREAVNKRLLKLQSIVKFITMEDYLAEGDYKDELSEEVVRPWLDSMREEKRMREECVGGIEVPECMCSLINRSEELKICYL
jgi:hypothetical protein